MSEKAKVICRQDGVIEAWYVSTGNRADKWCPWSDGRMLCAGWCPLVKVEGKQLVVACGAIPLYYPLAEDKDGA